MNIVLQVPLRCIIADSEERRELRELLDYWDIFPWEFTVQQVLGHDITEDRCLVYVDTDVYLTHKDDPDE